METQVIFRYVRADVELLKLQLVNKKNTKPW